MDSENEHRPEAGSSSAGGAGILDGARLVNVEEFEDLPMEQAQAMDVAMQRERLCLMIIPEVFMMLLPILFIIVASYNGAEIHDVFARDTAVAIALLTMFVYLSVMTGIYLATERLFMHGVRGVKQAYAYNALALVMFVLHQLSLTPPIVLLVAYVDRLAVFLAVVHLFVMLLILYLMVTRQSCTDGLCRRTFVPNIISGLIISAFGWLIDGRTGMPLVLKVLVCVAMCSYIAWLFYNMELTLRRFEHVTTVYGLIMALCSHADVVYFLLRMLTTDAIRTESVGPIQRRREVSSTARHAP